MKIERKFTKLGGYEIIDLPKIATLLMIQSYLSTVPEVRIRSEVSISDIGTDDFKFTDAPRFILTIKGDGSLTRAEVEVILEHGKYIELLGMTTKAAINKLHTKFKFGDLVLEHNIVDPTTLGTWEYIEVEFPSEEVAKDFVPPEWFGEEVTHNKDYKMKNYWLKGE